MKIAVCWERVNEISVKELLEMAEDGYFAGYFRNKERRFSGQDGKRIAAWRQEERTG